MGLSELAFGAIVAVAFVGLFLVRSRRDVVAVLTVYLVTLIGINARWVIPGTGAVGRPAMGISAAVAWWWWMSRVSPTWGADRNPNPVRVAVLAWLWFVALSWGLARVRPMSTIEVNASNTALIAMIGVTGLALIIVDGVRSRERLERLLRRIVIGSTGFSIVGMLQTFASLDLVALVPFPGLVVNDDYLFTIADRSGLARAEGTALHSIEFAVVLAMVLPLSLYFAMQSSDRNTRMRYMAMSAVIGAGIPLSVARSGLLAAAVALIVTSISWTKLERFMGAVAAAGGMIVMGLLVPGLIGTFRALVFGASNDTSVTARLDRIPRVEETFWEAPWLGTGIGTFSPDDDFLLDNQYFGTLLDTGIIGLVIVMTLFGVAFLAANQVRKHAPDDTTRYLSTALMGAITVLPVSMATFDAFFYRILMGLSFILIGTAGALWRMVIRDGPTASVPAERAVDSPGRAP